MIRRGIPRPRPGHGLPGAHIRRRRAAHPPGHRLAPRPGPAPDRVRPRVDRPIGARAAAGQAVLYQHRLRPGPGDLYDRPVARHLRRLRGPPDLSDQPAADPDPPRRHRGHSRGRPADPAGGRPATLYRFATRTLVVTNPFAAFRPPSLSPAADREAYTASPLFVHNLWMTCAQWRPSCAQERKCWGFRHRDIVHHRASTWENATHSLWIE